ncbi:MAG: T9SS type A sorting domain-containing protein [Bacteroidetes bacterium]|nr:T9SS type A sorting domain-containing protein [Bacteroidota bacterium]
MKNIHSILRMLLCGILFINASNLFASHMLGAQVTWKCSGKDTFDIQAIVYRDCNGIDMGSQNISYKLCGGSITSLTTKMSTRLDITPTYKASCTRCKSSSCSMPYGIERFIFTAQLITTKAKSTCCDIVLSWEQCCRNGAITTGISGNFYVEAKMNRCIKPGDNSPYPTYAPVAIARRKEAKIFNFGVIDDDGDSLVYYFSDPLSGAGTKLSYSSPYSKTKPLKFLGWPNADSSWMPNKCGFHFDSANGDIKFVPTKIEHTVVVAVVEEWGKDSSGKTIKKGEIRIDADLIVIDSSVNHAPLISGIDSTTITDAHFCVNKAKCFSIYTYDSDTADTVSVSWNNGIPSASFIIGTNVKNPKSIFCWKPTASHARKMPYTFVVNAMDNVSPLNGRTFLSYRIYVDPLPTVQIVDTIKGCNDVVFYAFPKNNSTIIKYTWTLEDSGKLYLSTGNKVNHHYIKPGTYKWRIDFENSYQCISSDSGTITIPAFVNVKLPNDTIVCKNTKLSISSTYGGGTSPYQFLWSTGDKINGYIAPVINKDTLSLLVFDNNKCANSDTMHIRVFKNSPPNINDERSCKGSTVILQDTNIKYKASYKWIDLAKGKIIGTSSSQAITDSGQYAVIVTDTFGCIGYDTANVYFNNPGSVIPKKYAACYGDTINMDGGISDSAAKWNWSTINASPILVGNTKKIKYPTTTINPSSMLLVTLSQTYKGVSCSSFDTMRLIVHPLPPSPNVMQSHDTLFSSNLTAQYYQWSSDSVDIFGATNSWFHPTKNGKYKVKIIDSLGCSSTSNLFGYTYTGIGNSSNELAFNIYPNPAKDILNIEIQNSNLIGFENQRGLEVSLFNTLGQKVYEAKGKESHHQIELKNIPAGIYMVQVVAGEKLAVRRTVVVRK